jgi:cytochrome c biogenesis protein
MQEIGGNNATLSGTLPATASGHKSLLAIFASVRLTVLLLSLIALTILLGAWCPQESQVGQEKVIEQFGEDMAMLLIKAGIADIFHTPFFLLLIGLLTVNMIACSFQRVFPKVRLLRQPMPYLSGDALKKLPWHKQFVFLGETPVLKATISKQLKRMCYATNWQDNRLCAESGKFGRLAPTVTHIGLLLLLLGVTITSWTGFSGFNPVNLNEHLTFRDAKHSALWLGKLPTWSVKVNSTYRVDYASGEAKQWFSDLSVVDTQGKTLKRQEISVNNPLSYEGVDIYQSSWGLDKLVLLFNGEKRTLNLRPMGKLYAAFLPLGEDCVLIFSVHDQKSPLRLFAKRPDWEAPRLLAEIPLNKEIKLGTVCLQYLQTIPTTGLQYKSDPGLIVTFCAFAFIITGVILAAVPHKLVWADISPNTSAPVNSNESQSSIIVTFGGRSVKAKIGFENQMTNLVTLLEKSGHRQLNSAGQSSYSAQMEIANV